MTPVRYHHAAEDELLTEIGYLEVRVSGLGRRFYAEVRKVENFLALFPKSAREVIPGIRKHPLRKFPFSLVYSIEKDCLLILAVAHHRRRPGYWIGRVSGRG
ncbi:MAG TPA: type II toxin-antitoxin system RelE/ParE family toxin [Terriglobia bacterium]|nr:type II toxin-antitoxin system RelE/ParE family toxin [Terriglobia bacterium]